MSEKQQVFNYIKSFSPELISGLRLEAWALEGFKMKASTASRRARELVESGNIKKEKVNRCVSYRYLPPKPKTEEQKVQESLDSLIKAII